MTLGVRFPQLGVEKKSGTRDLIIEVLSEQWPLSTKEIFNKIKKDSSFSGSYQAVHKVLLQMVESDVLKREEKKFQFNKEWIDKIKRFSTEFSFAYSTKQKTLYSSISKKENFNLAFDTPRDMSEFLIKEFLQYPNPEKKLGVILSRNCYPIIGLSIDEVSPLLNAFGSVPWYIILKGDTLCDKIFSKPFRLIGAKFRYGIDFSSPHDFFVLSDHICQIYWPEELIKAWAEEIKRTKKISGFDIKKWFDLVYEKRGKVHLIVSKNKGVADGLRKQVLQHFKSVSR